MLDPSMPWIASGYKKFLPQDFCSRHSKTPNSWEDDLHHLLHSPSSVSHQKRRVKSATASGRHRSHPKPPELTRPPQYRPKSASRVIRNGRDINIPVCSNGTEDPGIQTAYRLPRRPKSAIHVRHRPSLAQNKSVTEVERIHNARLMVSTIPVGRTTTNKPCAFCPVECRPKSSSSQRPISSTGLLAADVPSHFDRSNFWAKGTSRPRTAPTSRREFLHLPRHNYIRRGNVPHYTHFIKGLNLFPRDGSPLPHPIQPQPAVIVSGDEEEVTISSRQGGSTFKDDDTLGCGRSEIDDSDWEDIDSDGVDGILGEEEADKSHGIDETSAETETAIGIPEIDLNGLQPDTESADQQDESLHETDDVKNQPESIENQEELATSVETQDEVTPAGIYIPTITQNVPEEDVNEELANLSEGNGRNGDEGAEEEEIFPPAPSPSPVTVETESDTPVTTEILSGEKLRDSEVEKEVYPGNSEKEEPSEPPVDDLGKLHAGKDENDNSLKMEKEAKEENVEKASSDKKVKLEKEVGGLTPTVKMIPTPPVKEKHGSSSDSAKKVDRKQSQPTKRSKVKKEVRIKEPDAEKVVKPGEEDGDKRKDDKKSLEEKKKTEVNDTTGKGILNMGGEQPTPHIMLSEGRSPGSLEDLQPTPQIVLSEEKSPGTLEDLSSQQDEKTSKKNLGSESKPSSNIVQKVEPAQVAPKLGPPPPRMKVDIMGMDSETMKEILDLEMKLRRKGPGSYISDTEESLSDLLETPSPQNVKTAKKFVAAPWNCCRVALSRRAGRFEMPMDIRELVGMTPVEYLLKYCKVNAQRKALYKRTFSRVDKDCDGKINRKELDRAVTEVLVDTVNEEQLASVLKMIGIDDNNLMIKFALFAPLCALLERQYYSYFVTEDSSDREARLKDRLEDADFTALDWKLDGYELDENLRNLLYML